MSKILFLVDHDRIVRMFYHEKLARHGIEVATSSDMEGLFEKVDKSKPDIIVMDIKRRERFGVHPAFKYEFMSVAPGYFMAKARGSNGLKVQVKVAVEDGVECVDLILSRQRKENRVKTFASSEGNSAVPVRVPDNKYWQDPAWDLAQNH